jgi:large subunit ribosomal protein L30
MATKEKKTATTETRTEASSRKILVEQIRSDIGRVKTQRQTLVALGLGRIGKKMEHIETPSTVGMIRKVSHMVKVTAV